MSDPEKVEVETSELFSFRNIAWVLSPTKLLIVAVLWLGQSRILGLGSAKSPSSNLSDSRDRRMEFSLDARHG